MSAAKATADEVDTKLHRDQTAFLEEHQIIDSKRDWHPTITKEQEHAGDCFVPSIGDILLSISLKH